VARLSRAKTSKGKLEDENQNARHFRGDEYSALCLYLVKVLKTRFEKTAKWILFCVYARLHAA